MRWLRKAFGRRFEPLPALEGDGGFALAATGDGLYQAPLREVEAELASGAPEAAGLAPDLSPDASACEAHLVHEPDNPYDPGAVRVELLGRKVGYLRPDVARDLLALDLMSRRHPARRAVRCRARVVRRPGETPDDVALLRVRLDLALPLAEKRPPEPSAPKARRGALRRWSGAHGEAQGEGGARSRRAGGRRRPG